MFLGDPQVSRTSLVYCVREQGEGFDVEVFNHYDGFHEAWDTGKWIEGVDHPSVREFLNEEKTKRGFSNEEFADRYVDELAMKYEMIEINEIE